MSDDGILLLDKPGGLTSFAVVDRVRRALAASDAACDRDVPRRRGRRRRVGHAGTLDPLATGLLVVMVGRATRLAPYLMGLDKSYRARMRFGAATDTLDREGALAGTAAVPPAETVLRAATRFRGDLEQVPPVYSALKRAGRPLHARVRAGEEVEPPAPRRITIRHLAVELGPWGRPSPVRPDDGTAVAGGAALDAGAEFLAPDGRIYEAVLTLVCSSGTYVRSLARDLAEAAGTVGHLRELRRESVGMFALDGAVASDRLDDGAALRAAMRPLAEALPHVPAVTVDAETAARLRQGVQPEEADLPGVREAPWRSGPLCQVHDPERRLVAVCRREDPQAPWRSAAVFPVEAAAHEGE